MKENKKLVLKALGSFRDNDQEVLESLAAFWKVEHTDLLSIWCNEALSGHWRIFQYVEAELPGKSLPLKILMALRAEIRPRLVIRSSLMSVLRGN